MAEPFDQGDFKRAAFFPEITLEVYDQLPEDVCTQVEVVDGWMVRCESPSYSHQTIAHNLVSLLRDPVKNSDQKERTCHRVVADLDMLIAEAPKFHFRRPDVLVYRCVEYDGL
jgi:Putative restriction endonuclease